MKRSRGIARGVALFLAGALSASMLVGIAYAAAPSSQCTQTTISAKLIKCLVDALAAQQTARDDAQDRQLSQIQATQKQILDKLNSSPSPSPTQQPTTPAPDPSTPAPTSPAPTQPASVCTNPTITFTGEGSRGVGDGYDISAEQWGVSGYNYKSTLKFCSKDSWSVDVTTDNAKKDGAVKAYPSIRKIYHDWSHTDFSKDPRLSSFPKLTVDFAVTDPTDCPSCIYDTAFDIWVNGIGGSNNTELMIWTNNTGQRPYGNKVASAVVVDGRTWDLWSGNSDHYIAYVPTDGKRIGAGTVDVKAFLTDLIGRNRMAATSLPGGTTDPYIGQISFGVEPVSTNGVSQHWDFTRFNINDGK